MSPLGALAARYDRLQRLARDAPEECAALPMLDRAVESAHSRISLSEDGRIADVHDLRAPRGKKLLPAELSVPTPFGRTSGAKAYFLRDMPAYALGVEAGAEGPAVAAYRHGRKWDLFRELHLPLFSACDDPRLRAFVRYLETHDPEEFAAGELAGKLHAAKRLAGFAVFALDGDPVYLHDLPEAREIWTRLREERDDGLRAICRITGREGPVARLQPEIRGVDIGGKGKLLSFNSESGRADGLARLGYTPIHADVAAAYGIALNDLLARRRTAIGGVAMVWWCDGPGEGLVENLLLEKPPGDAREEAKIAAALQSIRAGRPLAEIDPGLHPDTRLHLLGLTQSESLIRTRYYSSALLEERLRRLGEHYRDLQMSDRMTALSAGRILSLAKPKRKGRDRDKRPQPPAMGKALLEAIWEGWPYPDDLALLIIGRLKAERSERGSGAADRVAFLKAWLTRSLRIEAAARGEEGWEDNMNEGLNPSCIDAPYVMGRLMAIYAYAERSRAARNHSVRDRYFASALETPAETFALLRRGYEHNRSWLARNRPAKAAAIEKLLQEAMALMPAAGWPEIMTLREQCLFAVGHDHQDREFWRPRPAGEPRENEREEGAERPPDAEEDGQ